MESSLFLEYVEKYFSKVVGKITEKWNGKSKEETLLHKTMLREEYSADLQWGATELDHAVVAADVVSLESSLPLKRRDKITNAHGTLPKLGVKMRKGEKLITDINVMKAKGTEEATLVSKIFDDTTRVIKAMDVRKEIMFEQALSTGACLVEGDDSNSTGIRVSYGYKAENNFGCRTAVWTDSTATPQDDVQQLFDKANEDGNSIVHVYLSKAYFDKFRKSDQGKLLAATFANMVITDKTLLPVAGRSAFLNALNDEYGATFHIVDSVFKVEKHDGSRNSVRPWREANIVGVPAEEVGRLVYGTLAEETNPVAAVSYTKSGSHVLVAKYSKTDPLEEFTTAQALCIPVIDSGESIYVLEADRLNISVDPAELSFTKSAASKSVTVTTTADGLATATTDADWLTLTISANKVTAAATANTGAERTAVITITDNLGYAVSVSVTQASGE